MSPHLFFEQGCHTLDQLAVICLITFTYSSAFSILFGQDELAHRCFLGFAFQMYQVRISTGVGDWPYWCFFVVSPNLSWMAEYHFHVDERSRCSSSVIFRRVRKIAKGDY